MLKRMRRIGLFVLAIAVVISSAIIMKEVVQTEVQQPNQLLLVM